MNHPNNPEVAVPEVRERLPYRYDVLVTLESDKPIKDVTDVVAGRVWSLDGMRPTVTATLMGTLSPEWVPADGQAAMLLSNLDEQLTKATSHQADTSKVSAEEMEALLANPGVPFKCPYDFKCAPCTATEPSNWLTQALAKAQAIMALADPGDKVTIEVTTDNGIMASIHTTKE